MVRFKTLLSRFIDYSICVHTKCSVFRNANMWHNVECKMRKHSCISFNMCLRLCVLCMWKGTDMQLCIYILYIMAYWNIQMEHSKNWASYSYRDKIRAERHTKLLNHETLLCQICSNRFFFCSLSYACIMYTIIYNSNHSRSSE